MILIEGLPGTGKSTLTKKLAQHYRNTGYDVSAYLETDSKNPFRYKLGTSIDSNFKEFTTTVLSIWKEFLKNNPKEIVIQESLTIQQQVNFPLVVDRLEEGASLIFNIFKFLEKKNPTLIYLQSSDPVEHFKKTMKLRGSQWVDQAVKPISQAPWARRKKLSHPQSAYSFIEEVSNTTDKILLNCPFRVNRFNVDSGNWDQLLKDVIKVLPDPEGFKERIVPHYD